MAWIKFIQPDGKFALFSTISDTFLGINMTKEELIDYMIERYREDTEYLIEDGLKRHEKMEFQRVFETSNEELISKLNLHIEMKLNCPNEKFNKEVEETLERFKQS